MTIPAGLLHQPKNTMPRIDSIWAFVSVDATDGNEGVCAVPLMGPGSLVPMIAADVERLDQLRPIAKAFARKFGLKVKLVRFSVREELEEFLP